MARLTSEALTYFEAHNGIASIEQLVSCGVSLETTKRLQRDGLLELVLQGAYRLRGHPLDETGRWTAVCTAHPGHAIAGPSAGRLFGLRRVPADLRVHTISPPRSQPTRTRWVKPYRTAAIHDRDIVTRADGVVHTSRPRTALDLARFLDDTDLLSVVEQVMRDGGHSADEMRSVAHDWISPRRGWLTRYLRIIERRTGGGPAESHPEVQLGDALSRAGLGGLVRQFPINLPGYGVARFDLAFPHLKWAIEVDLFPTHSETAGRSADERRDAAAHRVGWSVTRLPAAAFGTELASTVRWLTEQYNQRRTVRTTVG